MPRIPSAVLATTVALTTSVLLIPGASAAEHTDTVNLPLTCQAAPKGYDSQDFTTGEDGVTVTVTTPDDVRVGDEFTATIEIKPVDIRAKLSKVYGFQPKLTETSRIKMDLAIPEGLSYVGGELDEKDANLKGFEFIRVNESGDADPEGRILRLVGADGATIGNGPNSSGDRSGGVSHAVRNDRINMRFPVLKITLRADEVGPAALGVRTADTAGEYAQDTNFLTMLAKVDAPFVGTVWAPTRCTPRVERSAALAPQATAITTVNVTAAVPAAETSLTFDTTEVEAGTATPVTVRLSPADAAGTVTFSGGGAEDTVDVVSGTATGTLTLPTVGDHEVTAVFTPENSRSHTPSRATTSISAVGRNPGMTATVPSSARANTPITVTASLDPDATGTVTFAIAGASVDAPVTDGRATASIPVPEATGVQTLTADFVPTPGSLFTTASARGSVTVTDASFTLLSLSGPEDTVRPGESATITVTLQPVEDTTSAEGTVTLTADGISTTRTVVDNSATFEFTPDRAGTFPVEAAFTPSDDTQTPATATMTVKVTDITAPTLSVEAPGTVHPFRETPFTVSVTPSTTGSLEATVEGRRTTVPVENGTATVPLTFTRTGTAPVTLTFTPSDPAAAAPVTDTIGVTVTDPAYASATLEVTAPETVAADTPLPLTVEVTPDTGTSADVTGTLTFTIDGDPVVDAAGAPVTMPVTRGRSAVNLSFTHGGEHTVGITFTGADDVHATATHTVTVTGGTQNPGAGSSGVALSQGSSADGAGGTGIFAALLSLLTPLWTWLKGLFSFLPGGSS
ncbi:hypothetical protein [Corynebacterium pygosceleis]|uniref:Ig-like domain repeat protein n=1 Tax=Corynebacterium pygosceleis TaxID=2800406 RepID=A0A9Q4C9C5_9CORY|nr:hypothetical protein [Corynebacterium pygosceleis]MCK7637648.1 hypothetical protein [Corynebacterium pygosceleis]MCK7674839.1 hypothetical protein [Corynebacterium pygosceleis]MCL0119572.1 hypothetical protein [Corynebacterium pygosceleis]MCX7468023.1 hypothetical protein [Corynebacterium pygosceleis]